jgi:ligand-binding sensor domain-containing protein
VAKSPDGTIWIATNKGLNQFNKLTNEFKVFKHDPADINNPSNNDISAVCVDKTGNVWIGTWEGGLNLYIPKLNKFIHFKHNPDDNYSLSNDIVMSIYCDKQGTIWVGKWGGGLDKVNLPDQLSISQGTFDPD